MHPTSVTDHGRDCIHTLFEAQAAAAPDAPALRFRGRTLTYAELDERANRLAHHLRALGVGPDVPVGVLLPRAPELIATLLAVLKAGGAYVPLDPAYPRERIAYMLGDTRAPVLVTDAARASLADGFGGRMVRVDDDAGEIARRPATSPGVDVDPANLAYVIYTSGSSGRPKGVRIEHRGTVARLRFVRRIYSDAELGGMLGSSSVSFDASVAEVFGALCWGGTLILVENAVALSGLREPVTTAWMVPSAAAEVLRLGAVPTTLRILGTGGEAVPRVLADRLYGLDHVERVINFYGPTEDTTYTTWAEVERGGAGAPPIGRAVDGTTARVLDAGLREAPAGSEGEIWTSGAGVARGYVGAPALTAERFRPDPFSASPGARMYRTGDLGVVRPDGQLEYRGRADGQVKVRGFRIELGEVEAALLAHPAVAAAAVAPWDDGGDRRLAAYVVTLAEGAAAAELRRFVRGRLPDYMVPGDVVFLPALPLTSSGKVDRRALPLPSPADRADGGDGAREYVAPSTPVEAALAEIWAEVLGMERVGVRDDFFELGGHSLRATQIAARVRERLGAEIPLGDLFALHTVEELARRIDSSGAARDTGPVIPRVPRDGPLPLSFPQEAIWFFEQLSPGIRSYNFQAAMRIRGALDVPVLERTLTEIVRRHESFRTTFHAGGDERPYQEVHAPWAVHLPPVDLRHVVDGEREGELERLYWEEFRGPFRLGELPLVRWTLFRLADDEHVLLCVEHHTVHDGWSFAVFLREMTAIYSAFLRGEPSPLPELPIQYADWASWQRAWRESDEAQAQLEWWRRRLEGVPPVLELPADRPRPAEMSFRGRSIRIALPAGLHEAADAYGRARGATLFMTLFAAFQALLHRYTGETDFCVGSGVAGRRLREMEEMIGMVVNTVPIRAELAGDPTFEALVGRVRASAAEAYARQDIPFAEIVKALHPERSRGHLPVYQVAFSFHHAAYPELRLPGAELSVVEGLGNESAKFDLNVIAIPRAQQGTGEDVVMIWEWAEDLFDATTVQRMVGHFQALLADALERPGTPVSALRFLPADEERTLLRLGGAPTPYPRDAAVHALFAEQTRRTPNAIAVADRGRTLTYAELDAASTRLAKRLRALGVRAEDRVGVAMERSAEMVVAFLAAMKAGGAYVPLDPDHPAERLAYILEQSRATALVVRDTVPASLAGSGVPVLSLAAVLDADPADGGSAGGGSKDEGAMEGAPVFAESLACVLYTSGSTGRPKGVAILHRAIVRVVRDTDYQRLAADDVVAQITTPAFDVSLWEIWGTLLAGGRLVVIEREEMLAPAVLARRIREEGITTLFLTPTVLRQVVAEAPGAFSPVRDLLLGGEALEGPVLRRVLEAGPPRRILNAYGPTESTTYASWHVVDRVEPGAATVPIGLPVANTRLYVLDAALRPVPIGVVGELYIGGDGLARGYLGRPAMTAERFVPDPVSGEPGARLYRTGDRARWLASGALDYLGRLDHQVKVRGFRVETGEVEAVLRAHPAVADAAVVVREDGGGDRYLAAYVVADGPAPEAAELRELLSSRLAPYMVPSAFVALDALPLTPSGKLDRQALPAPESLIAADGGGAAAPETPTEEALAAIWREVLEVERVGAEDNFFDLGGHSLRATRIVTRVQARLGVKIGVGSLFDHPTVRALARLVDERAPARTDDEALLAWIESLSEEDAERLLADG